jgi:hypothetical protein
MGCVFAQPAKPEVEGSSVSALYRLVGARLGGRQCRERQSSPPLCPTLTSLYFVMFMQAVHC